MKKEYHRTLNRGVTPLVLAMVLSASGLAQAQERDGRGIAEKSQSRAVLADVREKLTWQASPSPVVGDPPLDVQAPGYGPGTHMVEFFNDHSGLWLTAKMFIPEGGGLHPAVVVLHGSGGLWHNDNVMGGVMSGHFEDWAQTFLDEGYVSLFIDSFTPRGLVEFAGKRPAEDPGLDDALCSPAYERTKDAYAGLAFLQSGFMISKVDGARIGLMGFSHGGSTALATVVSPTVTPNEWTVNYEKINAPTDYHWPVDPPQLPPLGFEELGFKAVVTYYPGAGFFGYFGPLEDFLPDLYMPYTPSLMITGSADTSVNPDEYPEYLQEKSLAHAEAKGVDAVEGLDLVDGLLSEFEGYTDAATVSGSSEHPLAHVLFADAVHSFDEGKPGIPNQVAKEKGQEMTLRWFESFLEGE